MNLDELYFKDNFTKEGDKVDLEINKLTAECITSKNNNFHLDSSGNLSVYSITTEKPIVTETLTDVLYPIGSIYMNVNPVSPSALLGGTWEQIKDRFLLACGNNYINGTMGGSESHFHETTNHELTYEEMPSHRHIGLFCDNDIRLNNNGGTESYSLTWTGGNKGHTVPFVTGPAGSSKAHNHGNTNNASSMPPYLAVYVWKRIA